MTAPETIEEIQGLREKPVRLPRGKSTYAGRYTVSDLLVLENPDDIHASASLTILEIADAIERNLVFTDQLVQRGIKPGREAEAEIELSVEDGYPDTGLYVFFPDKADEIAEKLLDGERLHLSPLVWNLRPGEFDAYLDREQRELRLYRGQFYLPDGHHRHQALLKAFRIWNEAPEEYPNFDPERQFTLSIHFMSREEEGEFFFEKNVLGKPVAKSKSYDLTTRDPVSTLAKRLIEKSPSLRGNVNRVTDQLSGRNPHVVTLSTLHSMMEQIAGEDPALSDREIEDMSDVLARFYEMLAEVRPELGPLDIDERKDARRDSMAAQAVVMHGYAELMKAFRETVKKDGLEEAIGEWDDRLENLSPDVEYEFGDFEGDLFDRTNPLWRDLGVIQKTRTNKDAVSNVRQTRASVGKLLLEHVGL